MNVKNHRYIRRLSQKVLLSAKKRNLITIVAIALTTLMFTSLFTIALSINATYQNYMFKQVGGYAHGAFKEVSEEQIEQISRHPKIKACGERTVIGRITQGGFAQTPGEVSYMADNQAKWSYALPTKGRIPKSANEIAMDTKALELLGYEPILNSEITFKYVVDNQAIQGEKREVTDTFTLVGYWEYDSNMPAHYLNISKEYCDSIVGDEDFRTDLDVMLYHSMNIEKQLESIKEDLGYVDDTDVRIGVNWGYTSANLADSFSAETLLAIASFLLLVIFTGYLIIYNIFQIAVAEDIRFYGLLKTIGVTPRQLKRLIRYQALWLCIIGIPIGLITGYGVGAVLTPFAIKNTTFGLKLMARSNSPFIFIFAILFAVITVLISCEKPGRVAGRVSPVDAVRFTDVTSRKKQRKYRGARVHQMAFANLGRNPKKTVLVAISLSLSVVLLNILVSFVSGFDMDTFLTHTSSVDFVVSKAEHFISGSPSENVTKEQMEAIEKNTDIMLSGCGYSNEGVSRVWMKKDAWISDYSRYATPDDVQKILNKQETKDDYVLGNLMLEGFDHDLLEKLKLVDGDLTPLLQGKENQIAIKVYLDDFGKPMNLDFHPAIGEQLNVVYCNVMYIDSRTGEPADEETPYDFYEEVLINRKEVAYNVCAYVSVPKDLGYRYATNGYSAVLPVENFAKDSGQKMEAMFYAFDTKDTVSETEAEEYLSKLTDNNLGEIQYESKKQAKQEFNSFKSMFLLMGGVLCGIIALVGVLNFFNAIMTGMISRRKELAVLSAVGMTNRQIRQMLVYEGLFYSMGSGLISFILSFVMQPLVMRIFEKTFWFYKAQFIIYPVLLSLPVFAFIGFILPTILTRQIEKQSVVERIREAD